MDASSIQNLTALAMADPFNQLITLTLPSGTTTLVPLSAVNANAKAMIIMTLAYGVELGASLLTLAFLLTMTPANKFHRFPTYLNLAALCNNAIRVGLLAAFFESSWVSFYALYTSDYSRVTATDTANSVASTALAIPQNAMVMLALMLQAWAMVRLWPREHKWPIIAVSLGLVALEMGFMVAAETFQIMQVYMSPEAGAALIMEKLWVRATFLVLEVACICWFCFLFCCKLVAHLWANRSFLAVTKGLGPMDALVVTNGVLMIIPVIFAGMQYSSSVQFEAGSMVYTSVVVILPLGSLVAQRIADPTAFSIVSTSNDGGSAMRSSGSSRSRFSSFKKALLHHSADKDTVVVPESPHSAVSEDTMTASGTVSKFAGQMQVNKPMAAAATAGSDIEKGLLVRNDRQSELSEEIIWWNEQLRM